jgi:hypothetical protein
MIEYITIGVATTIGVSFFSFLLSIYCLAVIKKNEGYLLALHKAPVLREYVKEYIPIDNSEEAKKVIKEKMVEAENEFNKAFSFGDEIYKDEKKLV